MKLDVRPLGLAGLKLIISPKVSDPRGFFSETYVRRDFAAAGFGQDFVQDNQSGSREPGTIRGLHFQIAPFAQAKLIRVLKGRIFDVCLDVRRGSPTFGRHDSIELDASGGHQLFIPEGLAHGFCTLEPDTEVLYKVTNVYAPEHERGILWNDAALGISWPAAASERLISEKDRALPKFAELPVYFE